MEGGSGREIRVGSNCKSRKFQRSEMLVAEKTIDVKKFTVEESSRNE
jgi:hypothetical protein